VAALAGTVEADREQSLTRLRLVAAVPALMARQALDEGKNRDLYGRVLAARSGRPTGDIQLRLVAAGLSAALSEAARYWAEQDGAPRSPRCWTRPSRPSSRCSTPCRATATARSMQA